jgi:hypothetical protein
MTLSQIKIIKNFFKNQIKQLLNLNLFRNHIKKEDDSGPNWKIGKFYDDDDDKQFLTE